MGNKVTAKDVAREAGVSVATVSYVMNGRKDQKISAETRKKILQIANLMNYVPSHAAKSLATGKNNTIGISYHLTSSYTRNAEILNFAAGLTERLNRMKYDVTIIPTTRDTSGLPVNRNIDAIIAIDLKHDDFRSLADNYLVPVICVDMIVNDTLFYQIYEDLPLLIGKAVTELNNPDKYYLIFDSYENSSYEDFVINNNKNSYPLRAHVITPSMIEKIKDKPAIIIGAFLTLSLLARGKTKNYISIISESEKELLPPETPYIINNDSKKANVTMNIVINSIDRNFDLTHDHRIR